MDMIKQEKFGFCGIACLAMVLGVDLQDVISVFKCEFPSLNPEVEGVGSDHMVAILRKYGLPASDGVDWCDIDGAREPAILTVPSLNHRGLLHLIVFDGDRYLDPAPDDQLTYPDNAPVINDKQTVCWASAITWSGALEQLREVE